MEYNKTSDGKYLQLEQKNVDTGMGVERTTAVLQGKDNVYETEIFAPLIDQVKELSGIESISENQVKSIRVIVEHARAVPPARPPAGVRQVLRPLTQANLRCPRWRPTR